MSYTQYTNPDPTMFFPYEGTPEQQEAFVRALSNQQLHYDLAAFQRGLSVPQPTDAVVQQAYNNEITRRQQAGTWPPEKPSHLLTYAFEKVAPGENETFRQTRYIDMDPLTFLDGLERSHNEQRRWESAVSYRNYHVIGFWPNQAPDPED